MCSGEQARFRIQYCYCARMLWNGKTLTISQSSQTNKKDKYLKSGRCDLGEDDVPNGFVDHRCILWEGFSQVRLRDSARTPNDWRDGQAEDGGDRRGLGGG